MNCASARCSRAIGPRRNVKRAPLIAAPVSKSSPSGGPRSACSCGSNAKLRCWPQRDSSRLAVSSAPSGTSSSGMLGSAASSASSSAPSARSSSSSAGSVSLSCATSALSASAVAMSPLPIAAPIAFDASLRRACAFLHSPRHRAPAFVEIEDRRGGGSAPRRARPASKASGFSRMARRSCMARALCRSQAAGKPAEGPPASPDCPVACVAGTGLSPAGNLRKP